MAAVGERRHVDSWRMKLNRDLSMNGLLGLVEWLVGCERPFMLAVMNGLLGLVEWLVGCERPFMLAVTNGLLGLVEWLVGCERPFMLAVQLMQGDVSVCVCVCVSCRRSRTTFVHRSSSTSPSFDCSESRWRPSSSSCSASDLKSNGFDTSDNLIIPVFNKKQT